MLSLDISGAFDNVNYTRLLHNLRKRGVPTKLVGFVASFLRNRKTTIRFGSFQSDPTAIQVGIPQGSVLSPILFLVFTADLLDELYNPFQRVSAIGFVDDTSIITYGPNTSRNSKALGKAHHIYTKWASKHSAKFALTKYSLIYFRRR